ncbi:hypothetical protein QBC39DRAFT_186553 [Podospora conica]|nr:hypothetical protein QBC39DRAFT_186553 [Schizothecium conicum]
MAAPAPKTAGVMAAVSESTDAKDPKEMVKTHWKTAQKLRAAVQKELERIPALVPDTEAILAAFEKIENWLARYRLICIQIIICDVKEAEELCSEDMLWNTTNLVTRTYRKVIQTLQGSSLAVTKRRVERVYGHSLTTAQEFYRTYLLRICSAYKTKELARNKELDRICRGPHDKQEGLISPTIPPGNPDVQAFVDKSFPKTLIFLGDLSRYRTLLRSRNRSFSTALTYYALANELMPNSGYGFHQSGVIYCEEGNHLEIVYNMYRAAIAVAQPHPLAQANLEREFRTLRDQPPTPTRGTLEAMVSWFVKLHAFYYKGDDFSGQKELENEVDNRLSMALRKGTGPHVDAVLLKMALINISAWVFGLQRTQADWDKAKSRSCEFILLLNIRTINTITRELRAELVDLVQKDTSQTLSTEMGSDGAPRKFTAAFYRILPVFRVYMTWLLFYSKDLMEFRSFLEPQFADMCQALAQTLTLLLELLNKHQDDLAQAIAWLFPEDMETIGMQCLNGPELPEQCRLTFNGVTHKSKLRADELKDADLSADNASMHRIFDAVLCGMRLAEHTPFPIMTPEGTMIFSYVEGVKPSREDVVLPTTQTPELAPAEGTPAETAPAVQAAAPVVTTTTAKSSAPIQAPVQRRTSAEVAASVYTSLPQAMMAEVRTRSPAELAALPYIPKRSSVEAAVAVTAAPPPSAAAINHAVPDYEEEAYSDDEEFFPTATAKDIEHVPVPSTGQGSQAPGSAVAPEFPMEKQLFNLLNDFLLPPEPSVRRAQPGQEESSYGMGSKTAAEIFGVSATTSPAPGSATSKAFPSLPWNYFMDKPNTKNPPTVRSPGSGWNSRPGSSGSPMGFRGANGTEDPFSPGSETHGSRSRHHSGLFAASRLGTEHLPGQGGNDIRGTTTKAPQPQSARNAWPDAENHLRAPAAHTRDFSNASASASAWGGSPVLWQHSGQQSAARPSPFSSSMAFTGESSMPAVNSPWGVPNAALRTGPSASMATSTLAAQPSYGQSSAALGHMGDSYGDESAFGWASANGQYNAPSQVDRGYATHPSPAAGTHVSRAEHVGRQVLMDTWTNDMGPRSSTFATADDANAPLALRATNQSSLTPRGGQTSTRANPPPSVGRLNWNVKTRPN